MQESFDLTFKAIRSFCKNTRVKKGDLARALGMHPTDLSPSREEKKRCESICRRMVWRLRREALPSLAVKLRLDPERFNQLEKLCKELTEIWIDPFVQSDRKKALNAGEIGQVLFQEAEWEVAEGHLVSFWHYISQNLPNSNDSHLPIVLTSGGALASLYLYQARIGDALSVIKTLYQVIPRGSINGSLRPALSDFLGNAAIAMRHQGHTALANLIAEHVRAYELAEGVDDIPHMVSNLRDQAKPLAALAIQQNQMRDPASLEGVRHVLDRAKVLTGGTQPEEHLHDQWLFTQLTAIECFTAMKEYGLALQVRDETLQQNWVQKRIADLQHPVAAKATFSDVAVYYCEGDKDKLVATAARGRTRLSTARYADRIKRLQQMEEFVLRDQEKHFLEVLVR